METKGTTTIDLTPFSYRGLKNKSLFSLKDEELSWFWDVLLKRLTVAEPQLTEFCGRGAARPRIGKEKVIVATSRRRADGAGSFLAGQGVQGGSGIWYLALR